MRPPEPGSHDYIYNSTAGCWETGEQRPPSGGYWEIGEQRPPWTLLLQTMRLVRRTLLLVEAQNG